MDEDDERSAYYSSVQDPSADDSVSPLSSPNINYWKPFCCLFLFSCILFLHTSNWHFITDPIPLILHVTDHYPGCRTVAFLSFSRTLLLSPLGACFIPDQFIQIHFRQRKIHLALSLTSAFIWQTVPLPLNSTLTPLMMHICAFFHSYQGVLLKSVNQSRDPASLASFSIWTVQRVTHVVTQELTFSFSPLMAVTFK